MRKSERCTTLSARHVYSMVKLIRAPGHTRQNAPLDQDRNKSRQGPLFVRITKPAVKLTGIRRPEEAFRRNYGPGGRDRNWKVEHRKD